METVKHGIDQIAHILGLISLVLILGIGSGVGVFLGGWPALIGIVCAFIFFSIGVAVGSRPRTQPYQVR